MATLALLAGCSDPQSQAAVGEGATPPAAAPVVGSAPAASSAAAVGATSRYTELAKCKLVRSGEAAGEDWSVSRCDPVGGITVELAYDDARDDLVLHRQGVKPAALDLPAIGGGGFNALGPNIEWRGMGDGASFKPVALIVRTRIEEDGANPGKPVSLLAVADLARACVVAMVRPGPGQNEQARAIADGPSRQCLTRETA